MTLRAAFANAAPLRVQQCRKPRWLQGQYEATRDTGLQTATCAVLPDAVLALDAAHWRSTKLGSFSRAVKAFSPLEKEPAPARDEWCVALRNSCSARRITDWAEDTGQEQRCEQLLAQHVLRRRDAAQTQAQLAIAAASPHPTSRSDDAVAARPGSPKAGSGKELPRRAHCSGMPCTASRQALSWERPSPHAPGPGQHSPASFGWDCTMRKASRLTMPPQQWSARHAQLGASVSAHAARQRRLDVVSCGSHVYGGL